MRWCPPQQRECLEGNCAKIRSPAKDAEESKQREEVFTELLESFEGIMEEAGAITTDEAEQTLSAVTSITEAGAGTCRFTVSMVLYG